MSLFQGFHFQDFQGLTLSFVLLGAVCEARSFLVNVIFIKLH